MIPFDTIDASEAAGLEDGKSGATFSPPFISEIFEDELDAYNSAYWHALAYIAPWPKEVSCGNPA